MRGGREKWLPGTVVHIKGPNSYIVRVQGNKHWFVHTDHMIHDDSDPREVTLTNNEYPGSIPYDEPVESDSFSSKSGPDTLPPSTMLVPNSASPCTCVDQSGLRQDHTPDPPSAVGASTTDPTVPGTMITRPGIACVAGGLGKKAKTESKFRAFK